MVITYSLSTLESKAAHGLELGSLEGEPKRWIPVPMVYGRHEQDAHEVGG